MEFHADSHFLMGKLHESSNKPCQDYAITAVEKDYAVAVVSDGCSSGGLTDVGARIIAHSAITNTQVLLDECKDEFLDSTRYTAINTARTLGLTRADLLATLVFAVATSTLINICIVGDGAFLVRYRDGTFSLHRLSWENNMPYYLVYDRSDSEGTFINCHGGLEVEALTVALTTQLGDGGYRDTVADGMLGMRLLLPTMDITDIVLFSDGIEQVGDKEVIDVVNSLTAFKNTTGDFAKRRLSRQVAQWKKDGHHPMDDISMAVIHINHEKEDVA